MRKKRKLKCVTPYVPPPACSVPISVYKKWRVQGSVPFWGSSGVSQPNLKAGEVHAEHQGQNLREFSKQEQQAQASFLL